MPRLPGRPEGPGFPTPPCNHVYYVYSRGGSNVLHVGFQIQKRCGQIIFEDLFDVSSKWEFQLLRAEILRHQFLQNKARSCFKDQQSEKKREI